MARQIAKQKRFNEKFSGVSAWRVLVAKHGFAIQRLACQPIDSVSKEKIKCEYC
jgi:hypothetical protein